MNDGINASPNGIIHNTSLINKMEKILRKRRLNQYRTNLNKKVIKKPKFKKGDIVRYYLIKGKFAKESNLSGSWSKTMYKIHRVDTAHKFKPMHTYVLAKIGRDIPIKHLPPIQENLLKLTHQNKNDLYEIEKILKRKNGKVLVKWADYEVPSWEPEKNVILN